MSADLIFTGGKIWTGVPQTPFVQALAVADGCILAVGRDADVEPLCGTRTKRVALEGSFAMPGIIDGHNHVLEGVRGQTFELQLGADLDFTAILDRVRAQAARCGPQDWIIGGPFLIARCPQTLTAEGRRLLDGACGGRPVLLRDVTFHSRFASTEALRLAGIDHNTADPPNGVIVHDAAGDPTGLLHESAANALEAVAPMLSPDQWMTVGRNAMTLLNGLGVTGFGLAAASGTTLGALKAMDEAGVLTAWAAGFCMMEPLLLAIERDCVGPDLIARRHDFATKHLRVDFAKFFMDGVPLMRTAAFVEPYLPDGVHRQGFRGHCAYGVADLADRIAPLDAAGISVKIHTIGDAAIRDSLDAFAEVRRRNGPGPRHSLAHLLYIHPEDVPRLAALNVIADLNPPVWFPNPNMTALRAALGDARVERSWPMRDILASGALAATGTDWPALAPTPNPWPGLSALITRRDPSGRTPGVHRPDQALTLEEALPLYTSNAAETLGLSHDTGRLAPGLSADMIVLDRDLFAIPPEEIAGTRVRQTWFEGLLVHEG